VRKRGASLSQKLISNHLALSCYVRYHSSGGSGDSVNGSADGIIDSTAATTQWKRNQYRKIEDKFNSDNDERNRILYTDTKKLEPLNIDNYEDVQPMWKEMESRVTRRRSLTLEQLKQRGGVSGRRNIRKSEEDYWERAGVYDKEETSTDKPDK